MNTITKKIRLSRLMITATFVATLISCGSDDDKKTDIVSPNAESFKNIIAKNFEDIKQTVTFKAEDGIIWTSAKGASVYISPNCLSDANGHVTGDVTMSFTEIYDRGTMVLTNKPVTGKNGNSELKPLVTGGQFKIEVKQGDTTLSPDCIYYVSIPASLTSEEGLDSEMTLWTGRIDENGDLIWEDTEVLVASEGSNDVGMDNYFIEGNEFTYHNVDRWYLLDSESAKLSVNVPSDYISGSYDVFLAYTGEPNVLTSHYGEYSIPLGNLHVIFVSESNGSLVYAIKQVNLTQDTTLDITTKDLALTTPEQLTDIVNNLQ